MLPDSINPVTPNIDLIRIYTEEKATAAYRYDFTGGSEWSLKAIQNFNGKRQRQVARLQTSMPDTVTGAPGESMTVTITVDRQQKPVEYSVANTTYVLDALFALLNNSAFGGKLLAGQL